MITPQSLMLFNGVGAADMSEAFGLDKRFVFVWARCHVRRAAGTGTETATMTISLDSGLGTDYDATLWTITVGNGADLNFRIPADEHNDWTFEVGDKIRFAWTNPDPGDLVWGLTVALAEAY